MKLAMPPVLPVEDGAIRPFWSVMIPTCGGSPYLEQAIRSVLCQIDASSFQLVVVENLPAGRRSSVAEIVERIGSQHVAVHHNDAFIGMAENWNRCIELATGLYVHILHDDDYVASNFYSEMEKAISNAENKHGVFACESTLVDEGGSTLAEPDCPQAFLISKRRLQILAEWNLLYAPSVVVERDAYCIAGGFSPSLSFLTDWEMWLRLGIEFGITPVNRRLAFYRVHSGSLTSKLSREGIDLRETAEVIELSKERGIKFNAYLSLLTLKCEAAKRAAIYRGMGDMDASNACMSFNSDCTSLERLAISLFRKFNAIWWIRRVIFYLESPQDLLRRLVERRLK